MNQRQCSPSLGTTQSNSDYSITTKEYDINAPSVVMASTSTDSFCDAAIKQCTDLSDEDAHQSLRASIDRDNQSAFFPAGTSLSTKSPSGDSQQTVFQLNNSKTKPLPGATESIDRSRMESLNFQSPPRFDRDNMNSQSSFLDFSQSRFHSNSSANQFHSQPHTVAHQSSYHRSLASSISSSDSCHVDRSRLYHSDNEVRGNASNQSRNTVRQTEQYGSKDQSQTRKGVEAILSNNNNSNIGIMQDLEVITFPRQSPHLDSPENMSVLTKAESEQDTSIYKCTNCYVIFPSQSSFISHLTCSAGSSVGTGNCIGGMPVSNSSTLGTASDKTMTGAIRHSLSEYGSCGFRNVGKKERCEEVSSSTGKSRSKIHQPPPFSKLLAHRCSMCQESFGNAETLRYHKTFCRPVLHTGTMSSEQSNVGRNPILWPVKPEPEVIDLTHSRSSSPEYKPCLSPQSASDLQRVPCEVCGKTYKNKYTLKTHYRIHCDQRPFTCSICLKRFKEKGVLKSHEKTHSDERPFSCPICFKCFKAKGTLKTHQKQIHPGMI